MGVRPEGWGIASARIAARRAPRSPGQQLPSRGRLPAMARTQSRLGRSQGRALHLCRLRLPREPHQGTGIVGERSERGIRRSLRSGAVRPLRRTRAETARGQCCAGQGWVGRIARFHRCAQTHSGLDAHRRLGLGRHLGQRHQHHSQSAALVHRPGIRGRQFCFRRELSTVFLAQHRWASATREQPGRNSTVDHDERHRRAMRHLRWCG